MRGEKFLLVLFQYDLHLLLLMCQLEILWNDYHGMYQRGGPAGCFLWRVERLVWTGRGGDVGC